MKGIITQKLLGLEREKITSAYSWQRTLTKAAAER